MSLENFPEEVLEKIINFVYHQSQLDTTEHDSINESRTERIVHTPPDCPPYAVYLDHQAPPILTTFQNLAVLNRRFHRICLPKLWEKIRFPSDQPAPISHWTENILLKHGNLVKSASFELDKNLFNGNDELFGTNIVESESTLCDNTVPCLIRESTWLQKDGRYRIGLVNIQKIFQTCPALKSVQVIVPDHDGNLAGVIPATRRLQALLVTLPRLQHLRLDARAQHRLVGGFVTSLVQALPSLVSLELSGWSFALAVSIEHSFGSIISHHQNLRNLSLENVTFDDQTWTLNSWIKRLTTLEIRRCKDLSARMLYTLLSGNAPSLTKLCIQLDKFHPRSDLTEQVDLPSLKELNLLHHFEIDLLKNFETCKDLEVLECCGDLEEELWNPIQRHLSLSTWPKLFILRLRQVNWFTEEVKIQIKKEVEKIWRDFGIHVFVDEQPYREEWDS